MDKKLEVIKTILLTGISFLDICKIFMRQGISRPTFYKSLKDTIIRVGCKKQEVRTEIF